ncbi:Signal transduction histidine-protein kinase BarA [Rubripirellula obstinata]|uniref:histidine kinase n=1 Tax=Rubripirellula obstinata TaxID=406547 RepID=A0A5B1CLH4_9BACT|nr:ATP-binding protein [Rubripirellula obstinata]KAA1260735.1 Signal transduction histidine-protein kinase BarA [Rubripirellula obstinata]
MIRFFQGLFASMSLERKCLLFFGSALLVLMFGAFLVVEMLGRRLVENTTLTRASDYSDAEMYRIHSRSIWEADYDPPTLRTKSEELDRLRGLLLSSDENGETITQHEFLGLTDPVRYSNLPSRDVSIPEAGRIEAENTEPESIVDPAVQDSMVEYGLLQDLESKYRLTLAKRIADVRPDVSHRLDLAENEPMSQLGPGLAGPLHKKRGPIDGKFIFYRPLFFKPSCMTCHAPEGTFSLDPDGDPIELANQYPFRVMKVVMPYEQTHAQTTYIRAIVVALGMLIVAVTLFVLHAIVRHLVLYPMYHLRDVSDAITHGDTNQRAVIETEDEFRELADAFNRMLRHLTETQDEIQEVNHELDSRVDQLAQLNLQLYEANRLKSDFLANMSHELRTPLNSIIGFSEVLQGIDSLNDKQRRYASNIQKSGRLLLEMINDILDLAKVEAGKMEIRPSEFDLARLVSAQCDMITSLSEEKNISLSVEVPHQLPKAYQDPNKLGQIINNLLSNAIKFTPQGGMVTVRISDTQQGKFRLEVADTGVGIAEEDQEIVFEKFRQSGKVLEGDGLTREYAGTGLGLSIVKELAKLLGGEIDFESELGRGSTFWITLPWRLAPRMPISVPIRNLDAPVPT